MALLTVLWAVAWHQDFFFKSDHHQHHNIGAAVMFIFTRLYVTMCAKFVIFEIPSFNL